MKDATHFPRMCDMSTKFELGPLHHTGEQIPSTDGRVDKRTAGQGETNISSYNFIEQGYKKLKQHFY